MCKVAKILRRVDCTKSIIVAQRLQRKVGFTLQKEDEERIMLLLQKYKTMSSSDIVGVSGYNKAKVIRLLNSLLEKNKIKKTGVGRGTRYGV